MARKSGNPKQRVIGPAESERICELFLQGRSILLIAKEVGACRGTVSAWIERHIRPVIRARMARTINEHWDEITLTKARAWAKLEECDQGLTEEVVEYAQEPPGPDGKKRRGSKEIVVRRTVRRLPNTTAGAFFQAIQKAQEHEAKLAGFFAKNNQMAVDVGYRVGGMSSDESVAHILNRIMDAKKRNDESDAAAAAAARANQAE